MDDDGLAAPAGQSAAVADRMQALLSRAVEEQISEQRSVAAVIGDLREQVAALTAAFRATASGEAVERLGDELAARTDRLHDSTVALEARVSGLEELVRESEQRVLAHVDEAVLALAEALLRRRRAPRAEALPEGPVAVVPATVPPVVPQDAPAPSTSEEAAAVPVERPTPWWRPGDEGPT